MVEVEGEADLLLRGQGEARQVENLALDVEADDAFEVVEQRPEMFFDGSFDVPAGNEMVRYFNEVLLFLALKFFPSFSLFRFPSVELSNP